MITMRWSSGEADAKVEARVGVGIGAGRCWMSKGEKSKGNGIIGPIIP